MTIHERNTKSPQGAVVDLFGPDDLVVTVGEYKSECKNEKPPSKWTGALLPKETACDFGLLSGHLWSQHRHRVDNLCILRGNNINRDIVGANIHNNIDIDVERP